MNVYVVDAFASKIFEGNQAGVVLLTNDEIFPTSNFMQNIASELKHSETVFVKSIYSNLYELKYYTPNGEVDLCGHATISAFSVLRDEKLITYGNYIAKTLAGDLTIMVEKDRIWMEMAKGKIIKELSIEESTIIYEAYGLTMDDRPYKMMPCIVSTGLSDILLPVNSKEKLDKVMQNSHQVTKISKEYDVIGVHMFYHDSSSNVLAYCRNFAPLYGIEEEAATGTSNGALTYYMSTLGLIQNDKRYTLIQGEAMGKPSIINSIIKNKNTIYIGGNAIISIKGDIVL